MHTKFLAISAAIFLMSSSVSALGNSEDFVGGLTQSDLVYPELALVSGQVGGLKRRNVHDLANGPRYGFPATEKKATFRGDKRDVLSLFGKNKDKTSHGTAASDKQSQGLAQSPPASSPQGSPTAGENNSDRKHPDKFDEGDDGFNDTPAKRSIVGTLFQKQSPSATGNQQKGGEEDDDKDEGSGEDSREAKRELKALRRRKARRDLDGALNKVKLGGGLTLHQSETLVGDTQKNVDKTVEILGNTVTGAATSLTKNGSQSKGSDSGSSTSSSDKKSSTDDTAKDAATKNAAEQPKTATTETSENNSVPAPNEPQAPVNKPAPESAEPNDSSKVNPEYMASSNGGNGGDSGSNYNGQYFA
ncbi:unnamed protein product [Absidia cylindrospora]